MRGNDLHRLLQTQFRTGNRFTSAYLDYFQSAQNLALQAIDDLDRLSSTQRMWFDYALSTNVRGEDLVRYIAGYKDFRGARYLDIGCGFGGSLVAAGRTGAECVGIEIDPQRAEFSRLNLADFELPIQVAGLDSLTDGLERQLGSFDIVTCNDVAEHVESAERLVRNIARLLKPGGLAYLEIPNGRCIEFVARDGHFGLFGITLLDREHARALHWDRFHYPYDVGDYWTLEEYCEFFRRAGLTVRLVPSLYHGTRCMHELESQLRLLDQARAPHPAIDEAYESYRAQLEHDRHNLEETAFRNRYLRNFWTFLASYNELGG